MSKTYQANLGKYQAIVDNALSQIKENNIIKRIWEHDHTVWKDDPKEISNRLGWLHSPEEIIGTADEINAFVDEVRASGYTHALLLGMGGSSMAPEVFRFTFGVKDGYLDLAVLDSTEPSAVLEKTKRFEPAKTLYIVSSKSGGTVETFSFMKHFYNETVAALSANNAGAHFVAITDPGSSLEAAGKELGFRKNFLNNPDIGGRYSVLSFFGLVPAALIGMDLHLIFEKASMMAENAGYLNCPVNGDNTAVWLGAAMGELAMTGRDKVTLITSPSLSHFGAWLEQLIAESTGNEGKGILPVTGETVSSPKKYAKDRLFIYMRLNGDNTHDANIRTLKNDGQPVIQLDLRDIYDLCGEFFRWEMATAIAGMRLGINPFYQPNVESAKVLTRNMVAAYKKEGKLPELAPKFQSYGISVYSDFEADSLDEALERFLFLAEPGKGESVGRSYVAIQAYLQPNLETDAVLQYLRTKIQQKYRMAVTIGYGPRFLHSTGQLHKGDAGIGLFIQFTADIENDLPIPDQIGDYTSSITFGVLINAQALGDRQALIDANRNVIRFHLGKDIIGNLKQLADKV